MRRCGDGRGKGLGGRQGKEQGGQRGDGEMPVGFAAGQRACVLLEELLDAPKASAKSTNGAEKRKGWRLEGKEKGVTHRT